MRQIKFVSLDFGSKAGLCWSFFWRGIAITLISMIVGGLLGGLFGFGAAMLGARGASAQGLISVGGLLIGGLTGLMCFYFYVRWLLSSQLGRFRLLLVDVTAPVARPAAAVTPNGPAVGQR